MVNDRHDFVNDLGKGGEEFKGPFGVSVSRNITSHKEKGIGAWTDAEIKGAITRGERKDGTKLKPPMGFPALCDYDRRRPQRSHRLFAHGAGEGMMGARGFVSIRAPSSCPAVCSLVRRRRWSREEKLRVVAESAQPGGTTAEDF